MKTGIAGFISIMLSFSFVSSTNAGSKAIAKEKIIMGEKMLSSENQNEDIEKLGPNTSKELETFGNRERITQLWDTFIKESRSSASASIQK